MIVHRAAWLLPIAAPPIRDGWVAVEDGRVMALGGPASAPPPARLAEPPFDGPAAVLPGLVNAHTHLELSWMQGCVPPADSMPAWALEVIARRRRAGPEPVEPIARAVEAMRRAGTALAGDVTNTLAAYGPLAGSGLSGYVFHEVLGFNAPDPDRVVRDAQAALERLPAVPGLRRSVVPHAPYSVSPELFRAVVRAAGAGVVTVHLAESAAEIEFLRSGRGAWRGVLEQVGAWNPGWTPPGCGPVEYLDRLGLLNERLLAVHGVHLTAPEIDRLASAGAAIVTCPRSNGWTGAGVAPLGRLYASGVRVAVGTDSLASVPDLEVFKELAAIRRLAPDVPARRILDSATRGGAEALGFGAEFGTIEAGRRAALVGVRIPAGAPDVEEYLLTGIEPGDIAWLAADDDAGAGGRRASSDREP